MHSTTENIIDATLTSIANLSEEKRTTQASIDNANRAEISKTSKQQLHSKQNSFNNTKRNPKVINNDNNGVTLRDSCCPCLLENLDSTTSILLQIYNEDRNRRNKSIMKTEITSANTKSKRSVLTNDNARHDAKRKKRKIKSNRKHRPKRQKQKKKQNNGSLLSNLDVCCLCNFLPEEDLSLLATTNVGGNSFQNDSLSSAATTQRIKMMTSSIFPQDDDIARTQETTPLTQKIPDTTESSNFKDETTRINILQGFPQMQLTNDGSFLIFN